MFCDYTQNITPPNYRYQIFKLIKFNKVNLILPKLTYDTTKGTKAVSPLANLIVHSINL